METRRSFYSFLFLFSVAMSASYVPKEGDIIEDSAFRSVDLRIIEKAEGTVMSLSDLVESYEVIKLENRDEALIKTYPFGIFVTDNYILLNPDAISPIKLFTRKGQYVADIGVRLQYAAVLFRHYRHSGGGHHEVYQLHRYGSDRTDSRF